MKSTNIVYKIVLITLHFLSKILLF